MKKKIIATILASFMAMSVFAGCSGSDTGSSAAGKKKIGVSMSAFDDKFLSYLLDAMKAAAAADTSIEVTYVDAKNDSNKQISQVENFITQGVDAIIVNPVDTDTSKPITDKAKAAKVPIVSVNRPFANQSDAAAYVGSDSIQAGILEMTYLAEKLGGKGNVAIMMGMMGQEAQRLRTEGIKQVVAKNPGMQVILEATAEWDRAKGMTLMENWLQGGKQIDALASNNDEMAIGAAKAIAAAGKKGKILVGGTDATPDGLNALKAGDLSVTVFQDAKGQGKSAIETAAKIAKGQTVDKEVWVPYELVKPEDADKYLAKWN